VQKVKKVVKIVKR